MYAPTSGDFLLDAISLYPVPGDPSDDAYQDNVPDMPYPFLSLLGCVTSQAVVVSGSRHFPVRVQEYVRDETRESLINCIIPGNSPRWERVPPPNPFSLIYALGRCSETSSDGKLGVALEHLAMNLQAPPIPPATPESGSKRKRFNAYAPPPRASGSSPTDDPSASSPTLGNRTPSPLPSAERTRPEPKTSRAQGKQRASS
ncbi:hypothetical protein NUW54_g564 [Trametes sanguinea]|uniref:Uncharacterized protein n=1 Tax=Trametes sanguinea TaxID=158606 RepID=A0ACC1QA77_9APHY|nr:hypothetical protein NUW54_g564 [Trametes sanguinea]